MRRLRLPQQIPEVNPNAEAPCWTAAETFEQSPVPRNDDEIAMYKHGRLLHFYVELLEKLARGDTTAEVPLVQNGVTYMQVMPIRTLIETVDAELHRLVMSLH